MLEERRPESGALAPAEPTPGLTAPTGRSVYRDPVIWLIAVVAFGAYATISLFRLLQLNPSSWDLGIYTEYVKQIAHFHAPIVDIRGTGFNLLGDHFQPIVGLIAPFFRIFPSAATLLVAQAALAAVSVFPVAQVAQEKLGVNHARAIAAAYGASWGLQQMIDFDFHEIAFAVPLLAFSLSALLRGRYRAAVWWALPLVFVKEDQGFTAAAIGLFMILAGYRARRETWRTEILGGAVLVVWGLAWSWLAITVIIPHFNPAHTYQYWSKGGVIGGGHPFSVLGLIRQTAYAWPVKLQTVVMLLLVTAFTALGSPVSLITLPSLALRFISTNNLYWGTDWHYNATVMPILFIAAVDAIVRIRARPDPGAGRLGPLRVAADRHGSAMMLAIAVALVFQFPLSGLWNGQTYELSPDVANAQAAMARVPDGATVQTTLDLLAPLAARTDTFWIGNSGNPDTQYIVFDGANSGYSPAPTNVPQFIGEIFPHAGYRVIFRSGAVYVFRRG
jgi:uncharacterized membrane protein